MAGRLSRSQRQAALASITVLAWPLVAVAKKYGLEVNQMAEEIRQARRERDENAREWKDEG